MIDFCAGEHKFKAISIYGGLDKNNQMILNQINWCSECGCILKTEINQTTNTQTHQEWFRVFGREGRLRDKKIAELEKEIAELKKSKELIEKEEEEEQSGK